MSFTDSVTQVRRGSHDLRGRGIRLRVPFIFQILRCREKSGCYCIIWVPKQLPYRILDFALHFSWLQVPPFVLFLGAANVACGSNSRLSSSRFPGNCAAKTPMASASDNNAPIFSAVSSSARQLFLLLRCVGFAAKTQVQITKEGLRFTVEESRVMQGDARGPRKC